MWFFSWFVRNCPTKIANIKGCLSSTTWELFEQIWNQRKKQTKVKENKLSNFSAQERSRHAYEKNEMVCQTVLTYCNYLQCKFTRIMNLTEDENSSVRPPKNLVLEFENGRKIYIDYAWKDWNRKWENHHFYAC